MSKLGPTINPVTDSQRTVALLRRIEVHTRYTFITLVGTVVFWIFLFLGMISPRFF